MMLAISDPVQLAVVGAIVTVVVALIPAVFAYMARIDSKVQEVRKIADSTHAIVNEADTGQKRAHLANLKLLRAALKRIAELTKGMPGNESDVEEIVEADKLVDEAAEVLRIKEEAALLAKNIVKGA